MTYWMNHLAFKIKVDASKLKAKYEKFKKEALQEMSKEIGPAILSSISIGKSPVAIKPDKFQDYSKAYNRAIDKGYYPNKTKKPINLKLTGKLLNSLIVKLLPDRINIRFDNEKFVYHNNEGVGKAKVKRRMLPTESGERFNLTINTTLRESLTRLIQKIFT